MDPQPILFRYTLIVRDLPALTYILPMAPDGWSENNINWSRDTKFFGLVRKFTTQLKFVEDGARILRQEYYTYRLFANVKIIIEKRNNHWGYDQVYYGQIDFSNVVSQKDYFVANAINLDISANIAAYADTTYEIPLDGDAVLVEVPPLRFFESAQLLIEPSQSAAQPGFPAIKVITNEVNASQASVQDQGYFHSFTPNFSTAPNWFFRANTNTSLKINVIDFTGGTISLFGSAHFQIQFVKSGGAVLANIVDTTHSGVETFNITQNYSFNLNQGESVYLYMRCSADISGFSLTTGTIQLAYFTSTPASSIRCFKAIDLFKKIIKKINQDVEYPIISNYLNDIDGLLLTSGEFIRNITSKTVVIEKVVEGSDVTEIIVLPYTPVMKTSLNDFYQSVRALAKKSNYGCAMGVENNSLRFEDLSYFFKSAVRICRLGNIKDYEDTPYIEYIFNNINAGYPDQTYNSQLNGRYEINSVQVYTSPVIQIGDSKKTLDLTSIYRGDPYGIEQIRVLETDTTNDYSDNDTFFLDCIKEGDIYSVLTAADFTNVTGTLAGNSLYNLDITPKRNLLRNGGFLRSALDADGYLIRFASGEKNTGVTSINPDGVFADEHANIDITSLPAKIFIPIQVTITTDYPKDMIQLLDAFVGGYIEFEYRGSSFKGFPIDVTTDITKNSSKQIKLLLLPGQDLSALIHPVKHDPIGILPPPNTRLYISNNTDDILITYLSGNLPPEILLANESKEILYNDIKTGVKFQLNDGINLNTVYTLDYTDSEGAGQELIEVKSTGSPHGQPFIVTRDYLTYGDASLVCKPVIRLIRVNQFGSYLKIFILIDPITFKSSPAGDEYFLTGGTSSTVYSFEIPYTSDDIIVIDGTPVHWEYRTDDVLYFRLQSASEPETNLDVDVFDPLDSASPIDTVSVLSGGIIYSQPLLLSSNSDFYGIQFIPRNA